ncbi:MAG: hypothetical protein WCA23_29335, partial [Stellaceae bacterium]
MRVYIIGNDGITLCRRAPNTVNDGEIALASNEELDAAPLSAKRLLALWNALPGVAKNCSFSRDVMRQSSRAVLRQRSNGVGSVVWSCERSCLRG